MLRIDIRNLSHLNRKSNYEYTVMVSMAGGGIKIIAKGDIEGHMKADGWKRLVQRVLNESNTLG